MSDVKNCHYISRFHTRPWEVGERDLVYFETGTVERHTSRTMFSREQLNTPEVEARLNRLVETPLGKIRAISRAVASSYRTARPTAQRSCS